MTPAEPEPAKHGHWPPRIRAARGSPSRCCRPRRSRLRREARNPEQSRSPSAWPRCDPGPAAGGLWPPPPILRCHRQERSKNQPLATPQHDVLCIGAGRGGVELEPVRVGKQLRGWNGIHRLEEIGRRRRTWAHLLHRRLLHRRRRLLGASSGRHGRRRRGALSTPRGRCTASGTDCSHTLLLLDVVAVTSCVERAQSARKLSAIERSSGRSEPDQRVTTAAAQRCAKALSPRRAARRASRAMARTRRPNYPTGPR